MEKILFGAAYYDEYMPYDRLQQDIEMMKKAGINTVRIAESTWSTCEPQAGVFDFSHVERVLDAMEEADISVIIGTPTYAVPTWMVKAHPEVLAETKHGKGIYGARQIMDITNPTYLFYAERVIRELMKRVAHRTCVIGYQLDNETKYYGTAGKNVQERFVKYLREQFEDNLDEMNAAFGLDYWSNRINAWEDFPDVRGTINGSLGAEFEKFQRMLVTEFLNWQADIVRQYCRQDQFITHNFDFEWRGYSYGVQPDVDQFAASECMTIAGADIYHPTQDELTGAEIAFGGDMARSLKRDNYLLLETQAQGFPGWVPYEGQLRLQAYSHLACGANSVMYWHWHSLHNGCETYWKGLLSHDFEENDTYLEACRIGKEFSEIGEHLVNLKKKNEVAILVSNESLTALNWFGIEATAARNDGIRYNDVVRWIYDALYQMNVECDFLSPQSEEWSQYKAILVPALYSAPDALLQKLKSYVAAGGHLLATFKTGFANEYVKVSHERQPHHLTECFGMQYHQFTFPKQVKLSGELFNDSQPTEACRFMELLIPTTARVLVSYEHDNWKKYAAVTANQYKNGMAVYIGCGLEQSVLKKVLTYFLTQSRVEIPKENYPVILRKGYNNLGHTVTYYLNYSNQEQQVVYEGAAAVELLSGKKISSTETMTLQPWGVCILES